MVFTQFSYLDCLLYTSAKLYARVLFEPSLRRYSGRTSVSAKITFINSFQSCGAMLNTFIYLFQIFYRNCIHLYKQTYNYIDVEGLALG